MSISPEEIARMRQEMPIVVRVAELLDVELKGGADPRDCAVALALALTVISSEFFEDPVGLIGAMSGVMTQMVKPDGVVLQ